MKVLQVFEGSADDGDCDIGRQVADMARGLTLRGHEIHTFHAPLAPLSRFAGDLAIFANVLASADADGAEPPSGVFGAILRCMRRSGPFDVIHAHGSSAGAIVRAASVLSTAGVIYTPHGVLLDEGADWANGARPSWNRAGLPRLLERLLAHLTSRIVCSSMMEYEHLASELRIAEHRLALLHPGLSPESVRRKSNLRGEFGLSPEAKLVGFVGRLSRHKGGDVAIRALQALRCARCDAHLVVIGTGPEEAGLRALADTLGIASAVHWLGRQPADAHYHNFDAVAFPSRSADGSIAPLEALHRGIPVVATLTGAPHELISHGLTGFVIPPDDPAGLARQIMAIFSADHLQERIAAEARKLKAYLELDRMLDELEEIYFGRLAGRRPFPAGLPGEAQREMTMNRATIG